MPTESEFNAAGIAIQGIITEAEALLTQVNTNATTAKLEGPVRAEVDSTLIVSTGNVGSAVAKLLEVATWCFRKAAEAGMYTADYDWWERNGKKGHPPVRGRDIDYG